MKKEGDDIAEGEILFNVETDKSVMEVEAKVSGTLLKIVHDCGDEVPIQQVIGYIGNQGEAIPNIVGSASDEKIDGASGAAAAARAKTRGAGAARGARRVGAPAVAAAGGRGFRV